MREKLIVCMALFIVAGFLGACNTVEGAGRDIEDAGEWVQDTF